METTMRTYAKIIFSLAVLSVLAAHPASAQIVKKAQVGFRFLENPVSAEVVGRGTAGLTSTYSSNAIFWNPALLGWIDHTIDAGVHYTKGISDINYNAASASIKIGDFGVVGLSVMAMDYGTFYSTYALDNGQGYVETGTFSPNAYSVGIAFSQKMNDHFSYGVHAKYVSQDLGKAWVISNGALAQNVYVNNALAFDVGALYDFNYYGIRFGATLQNISREIKYEKETSPLPFAVSFGVAVMPLTFFSDAPEMKDLTVNFEMKHPRDFGQKEKYGAEYTFYHMFTARLGYMTNYDERGLTAGVGVQQAISDIPLRIDYAYEPFGVFGAVHYISLGVSY